LINKFIISCTHRCIIHGPCKIGINVFVSFHAIVLDAIVEKECYISPNALVTGGVKLEATAPPGASEMYWTKKTLSVM